MTRKKRGKQTKRKEEQTEEKKPTKPVARKMSSIMDFLLLLSDQFANEEIATILIFKAVSQSFNQVATRFLETRKLGPFPICLWLDHLIPSLGYFQLKSLQRVSKLSKILSMSSPRSLFISPGNKPSKHVIYILHKKVGTYKPDGIVPNLTLHPLLKAKLSSAHSRPFIDAQTFRRLAPRFGQVAASEENVSDPPAWQLIIKPFNVESKCVETAEDSSWNKTEQSLVEGKGNGGSVTVQDALTGLARALQTPREFCSWFPRSVFVHYP